MIKMNTYIRYTVFLLLYLFVKTSAYAQNTSAYQKWSEGEKLIAMYKKKNDTLKLKAAEFLVRNIPKHFSIQSKTLDKYYAEIATINKTLSYPDCVRDYDSLYQRLGDYSDAILVCDTSVLDAKILEHHIEAAFKDWREGYWARHLSFDDFCEYLLPYRVGNEKYEDWREVMRKDYLSSAESTGSIRCLVV